MEIAQIPFPQIIKRDGSPVEFNLERIVDAIFKAAQAVGGQNRDLAEELAHEVMNRLRTKIQDRTPTVEEIQDTIEKTLIEAGHAQTAKAFILYREKRKEFRETRSSFIAIEKTVDQYLPDASPERRGNTLQGLIQYTSGSMLSHYALNKIYPPAISEAHRDELIHIHHLGSAISPSSLILKSSTPLQNFDDTLEYLQLIQQLRQECQGYLVICDFESILTFCENAHILLKDQLGQAKVFIQIQKPETLRKFSKLTDLSKLPGMLIDKSLSKEDLSSFSGLFKMIQASGDEMFWASSLTDIKACLGVVSINLKRLAEEALFKKDFLSRLEKYLLLARQALQIKKKVFQHNFQQGMFPATRSVLKNGEGVLGISLCAVTSAAKVLTNAETLTHKTTENLALEILHFVKEKLKTYEKENSQIIAIENITENISRWNGQNVLDFHACENESEELLPFSHLGQKELKGLHALSREFQIWIYPISQF